MAIWSENCFSQRKYDIEWLLLFSNHDFYQNFFQIFSENRLRKKVLHTRLKSFSLFILSTVRCASTNSGLHPLDRSFGFASKSKNFNSSLISVFNRHIDIHKNELKSRAAKVLLQSFFYHSNGIIRLICNFCSNVVLFENQLQCRKVKGIVINN